MKKTQLFENRNILKRVLSWMLLFSILFSTVPVQAAGNPDITLADLFDGLGDAANYGATAITFTELGHAESNVLVEKLVKQAANPILTSGRGQNAGGEYSLVADVTLIGPYDAIDSMTFGVFKKTSSGYSQLSNISPITVTNIQASKRGRVQEQERLHL